MGEGYLTGPVEVQAVNSLIGLAFFLQNNTNIIKFLVKKILKQFTITFNNQNGVITSLLISLLKIVDCNVKQFLPLLTSLGFGKQTDC